MKVTSQTLFLALLLFSIMLRLPVFFPTVMDHDESTYLIIAQQLLQGKIPYVDNLDVKPVGIYLLFAAILKIWNSIFAIRLFAAIVLAISGYLLYKIHFILFSHARVAMVVAFLYLLCANFHKWTWSSNTEVFFQCFSLWALYILLLARRPWHFMGFGIVAGIGFLVKFHIVFDVLAFSVFYFFWQGSHLRRWFIDMILASAGFCIPIGLLILTYWKMGFLDELKFAMITIPSGYSSAIDFGRLGKFILEYYLSYFPILILVTVGQWVAFRQHWMMRSQWVLFLGWTIFSWIGIAITGKFFFHYYFQALPVMCLFALTWFMVNYNGFWYGTKVFIRDKIYWIFGLMTVVVWINQYLQVLRKPDITEMIYKHLEKDWKAGDIIYTTDKNVLYYLLKSDIPTRYIHTSVIYDDELIKAYEVDVQKELQQIVDRQIDYYVILKNAHPILEVDITENFRLEKEFPNAVKLYYRIKD